MAPSDGKDNRQSPRIPKEVHIDVSRITFPMAEGSEPAIGKNIAKQGICFTGPERYEPGTSLVLKIELKGWQHHKKSTTRIVDDTAWKAPLTAVAEVVWSKQLPDDAGHETGLRFTDIYEDDYKALKTHLDRLAEKMSDAPE